MIFFVLRVFRRTMCIAPAIEEYSRWREFRRRGREEARCGRFPTRSGSISRSIWSPSIRDEAQVALVPASAGFLRPSFFVFGRGASGIRCPRSWGTTARTTGGFNDSRKTGFWKAFGRSLFMPTILKVRLLGNGRLLTAVSGRRDSEAMPREEIRRQSPEP